MHCSITVTTEHKCNTINDKLSKQCLTRVTCGWGHYVILSWFRPWMTIFLTDKVYVYGQGKHLNII
jgi:hypothetical protein